MRDHAPAKLSIVRRLILDMLKLDTTHSKRRVRLRQKVAGRDDDERMRVLQIQPPMMIGCNRVAIATQRQWVIPFVLQAIIKHPSQFDLGA
ncbi:MAG: hypothetical protein H6944_14250 [Zoogloeaceae bacterium]|nr:hypothetical protein [Rhodocyclaceae bacterium]MCP5222836.1 hypothetical protein [Zoogloeaceae bacterium]HQU90043.1 hypothetical protein [Denitromonas sp.]